MERKYSVSEIDRMRKAVRSIVNIGGQQEAIAKIHEEHLRTYMLNGTSPEELEEEATRTEIGLCLKSGIVWPLKPSHVEHTDG